MIPHSMFAGTLVHDSKVELARATLLFLGRSHSAAAVFIALWSANGKPVEARDLLAAMPERDTKRVVSEIWNQVEYLHRQACQRGWPIRFECIGSAFLMVRLDRNWSWRDLVPDSAAIAHHAMPDLEPHTARLLGSLMQNHGNPTSTGQIVLDIERMCGSRLTPSMISQHVQTARKALVRHRIDLQIRAIRHLGYELYNPVQPLCLADRFLFTQGHGELDIDRVAAACDFLRLHLPQVGLVFLILWDRRDEVVSYDTVLDLCQAYTGEAHSRNALHVSVKHITKAVGQLNLGISIRGHINLGYQLQATSMPYHIPRTELSRRSGLSFHERVAQLATRLPQAECSSLRVLQILRARVGGYLSLTEISKTYAQNVGEEITYSAIKAAISRARRHMKAALVPMTITRNVAQDGYCLWGDVDGWMAGKDGTSPDTASLAAYSGLDRHHSTPTHKTHFGRSFYGYNAH